MAKRSFYEAFRVNSIDTSWLDGLIRERAVRLKYERRPQCMDHLPNLFMGFWTPNDSAGMFGSTLGPQGSSRTFSEGETGTLWHAAQSHRGSTWGTRIYGHGSRSQRLAGSVHFRSRFQLVAKRDPQGEKYSLHLETKKRPAITEESERERERE